MNLRAETQNPRARVLLDLGLEAMREYQDSAGNLALLEEAEGELNAAVEADPGFLPAVYFRGITRDLKGETDAAIADLESVVKSDPTFSEARFNLGVASFHKYHEADLKRAESEFEEVLSDPKVSHNLRLQTLASLAQTQAQLLIQRGQVDVAAVKLRLEAIFRIADVIQQATEDTPRAADPQVQWRLENALGLGFMFASDYLETFNEPQVKPLSRSDMLRSALQRFTAADRITPGNWAVICNLGSVWMRGAYWQQKAQTAFGDNAFQRSFDYLYHVIRVLRPNYGFALYEIGRLHRLTGRFSEAIQWFGKAEAVPESKRDVSAGTLKREIDRAKENSDQFP